MPSSRLFLGLDFGTESVRAILVDAMGRTGGSAVSQFRHGQIVAGSASAKALFPAGLPPLAALQHPGDWIESAGQAVKAALTAARATGAEVGGIGVDFTSCTMLPCRADGTPLCLCQINGPLSPLAADPHAWPKLWKHHGAIKQTAALNAAATRRAEPWLKRYGGIIGLEWFFPKMLEVIEDSPAIADAADIWLEGGDWFVWMLTGGAGDPPRSTCQAGYKGLWSPDGGFPSHRFLSEINPRLAAAAARMAASRFVAPGTELGGLGDSMAAILGLEWGTPISAAIIDAHAGVPGAGVGEAGTLVMVMGTSGCHMLLSDRERFLPGVAGVVKNGILPGFYGYETGQAAMGDAFDLVRRLTGSADFKTLTAGAEALGPGSGGVLALDWFNGCRTPLMDGALSGGFLGLTLAHSPAHLFRATLEATAFGLKWIVDTLREGGVPVTKFVATGGLPHASPLFMRIAASVLGEPIVIHGAEQGPALGAAILGALAAGKTSFGGMGGGGFDDIAEAVACMAGPKSSLPAPVVVAPVGEWREPYASTYNLYRQLAAELAATGSVVRQLHSS